MTIYSKKLKQFLILVAIAGMCIPVGAAYAWHNVITPGDPVMGIPDDGDWPDAEAPQHAIDGDVGTKFLHFMGSNPEEFGIAVTIQQPAVVHELSLVAANDGPDRDPTYFTLYGSNGTLYDGPWTLIAEGPIVDFEGAQWPRYIRNKTPIVFENDTAYEHYQVLFTEVAGASWFQLAEIELITHGPVTAQPQSTIVPHGQDATFALEASGANPVSYQWYKVGDDGDTAIDGATDPELVIAEADFEDEGSYYCVVTDTATQQSWNSKTVNLAISRLMAHWTMDEADYDGTYYLDVSTEDPVAYNAQVNEVPTFVDGMVGDALDVHDTVGAAHAGHWNPMEYSDQMTLSAWINWHGQDNWQKILAKRTHWNREESHWQWFIHADRPDLMLESFWFTTVTAENVMRADGQWQHIAVTYDGYTARIYVDGELQAQGLFMPSFDSEADFMIASAQPNWMEGVSGLLDDVKVYNYALSTLDIAEMYHSDSGRRPCLNRPSLDITGDCKVGLADFAQIATWWLHDGLYVD